MDFNLLVHNIKGLGARYLKLFRQFYLTYPQIGLTISAQLKQAGLDSSLIVHSSNAPLQNNGNQSVEIWQLLIVQFNPKLQVPPEKLISQLSFTHLASKEQFTQFIENELNRLS